MREMRRILAIILVVVIMAWGLLPVVLAQDVTTPTASAVEYRSVPYLGSRNLIWIVAQIHLLINHGN